ncbi:SDR family NAD(P)-dependent oxidoreductase [Sphingobium sp. PNB]|uniref:type I polyketide synthase n=1 Tax=Sphingobium sp. PNB TaxID=863934 RepID=UPI001CA3A719|nr:type I polyketide synthase [Sphingobium sp. PNB]MCB4858161.1 SDR family NAD(P)-dependent oxidoreductase [Sphingobium sp. PNB]
MDQHATWPDMRSDDPDLDNHVAVVGMACRFAGAPDLESYWTNLREGRESIVRLSDEQLLAAGVDPRALADPHYVRAAAPMPDMEMFDATLFGLSARDAAIMDPQHRHFLQCAWAALENAGHAPDRFRGAIGVFAGSGHNAYLPYNLLTNPDLVRQVGFFLMRHTGNDKDFLATRASYLLDLKGPSVSVQTACSTSLVAIHMAMQSLLNGESDMALAGGVTIELPHGRGYRYEPGEILSPDGHCRAFDAEAAGTVFGSGAGVVVLRRLRDAMEDGDHIHAIVRSSAVNNDGMGKVSYLAPSVDGQARAIAEALSIANVDAGSIGYVETHGTGTPVGDPIEIAALTQAFRENTDAVGICAIGSVKPNIGHTDTAAGVASFIKVALALQHRELPPSLHHSRSNPACGFERSPFFVNGRLRRWDSVAGSPLRAGVSSLGVGGTNCHVVMEEAPPPAPSGPSRKWQLLVQSAASPAALEANGLALADHLERRGDQALADIAFTLQRGRKLLPFRRIAVAQSHESAAGAIRDGESVFSANRHCVPASRKLAFLFAGGGAQYVGMARDLYEAEPVFRDAVDECLALLADLTPTDFRAALFPGPDAISAEAMQRPAVGLPLLFSIQYATARLWMSWGVEPDAMIGHSMGEYVVAHLAGVFDLQSALRLAWGRARLFESLPPGGMLSVPLSEEALRPHIGQDLSIAAVNGAALTVASGPIEAIEQLRATLESAGVSSQQVAVAVAAHSAMLDPILDDFRHLVNGIRMQPPGRAFLSSLTGDWARTEDVTDPDYWVRHLRETVRFDAALEKLLPGGHVLLEVGPGRTLASLARQHRARGSDQPVFNSLRHADEHFDDQAYMLKTLGCLWMAGYPVAWEKLHAGEKRRRVPLPGYRFERQRHWIEPGRIGGGDSADDVDMIGHPDKAGWFYRPAWRLAPLASDVPEPGTALLFLDEAGLGDALAARLQNAGCAVTTVRAGKRFRVKGDDSLTINPARPEDYERLVAYLADRDRMPRQIFHHWLVGEGQDVMQRGFWSLFHLCRALGEAAVEQPITIGLISTAMQRIGDEPVNPAKAAALGACRVIPGEYPAMRTVSVDVDLPDDAGRREELAACIVAEVTAEDSASVVAYRRLERWVEAFETQRLAPADKSRLRPGGTYLITGGLGGIGLRLAEHLFETQCARLVLVARGPVPPRNQWAELLATLSPGDIMCRRIRRLRALEEKGAEILLIEADISDSRQMRKAVASARSRFGPIHGVFHMAGLLNDGPLALKSMDGAAAVLAPKVQGTMALERALAHEEPDFLMLFSSISAVAGIAGQADYAAANAFLDSYARHKAGRGRMAVIAAGWPRWQETGMAASIMAPPPRPLRSPENGRAAGAALLDRILIDTQDRRTVSARLSPRTHWLLDEHRLTDGAALLPGSGLVELVRQAFQDIAGQRPFELREVLFLEPFAVADDGDRDLQIDLLHQGGEAWRFHIMGRDRTAEQGAPWTQHARGHALIGTPQDGRRLDRETIAARCPHRPVGGTMGSAAHLSFGPRWQNIEAVHIGHDEALIDLRLPDAFAADLPGLALHPALLDFATAGTQMLIPGFDGATDFYAPASYGALRLTAPLPAQIVSHVRLRPDETQPGEIAVFDISIASPQGQVLAEIEGFAMMRLRQPSSLTGSNSASPAMTDADDRTGLSSLDGMEVIDRLLASRETGPIIISPQKLNPMLAKLRAPSRRKRQDAAATDELPPEESPRTETERIIAAMWQDMLGTAAVRRNDDFFDLGGHSLLAVQLINRLRKRFGQNLPLTALIEAPTLARLAALITPAEGPLDEADRPPPAGPAPGILLLRPGDEPGALFLVHDGLGETLLYRTLALQLEGPPVFAIQPERHPDGSFVHSSISAMARGHVERMRKVQPAGPYMLAGLCAGGVIAAEMARQLEDAGEDVAYLGIMDAADVEASERPFHAMRMRWRRVREGFGRNRRSLWGLAALIPGTVRKFGNMLAYEMASRRDRRRMDQAVARARHAGEAAPAHLSFLELYQAAHRMHRPSGLIQSQKVVLYKATAGNGAVDDHPFSDQFGDVALGWGRRVAHYIEVVEIAGGHSSALQEPHVTSLARLMQDALDDVLIGRNRNPAAAEAPVPRDLAEPSREQAG